MDILRTISTIIISAISFDFPTTNREVKLDDFYRYSELERN